jgi:hypothetical protein
MSRAEQFRQKLRNYGEDVTFIHRPSTSARCACWEFGFPDPDCLVCDGSGYVTGGTTEPGKAFVLPTVTSTKLGDLNFGVGAMGSGNIYVDPDLDLTVIEKVMWDGMIYELSDRDRMAIAGEIIYRYARIERVDT